MPLLNDSRSAFLRERTLNMLGALHVLMPVWAIFSWCKHAFNLKLHLRNARFRRRGADDGLPLPPPKLIHLVSGMHNLEFFYYGGKEGAAYIAGNLAKHGVALDRFANVLDFGCGCGRILRHMKAFTSVSFFGTDYNPLLSQWCNDNLPFTRCTVNTLSDRLPFADQQFDFIYAISVFTHLAEDLQFFWIEELRRVLKPGGYCYLTVNGRFYRLTNNEMEAFSRGELVVQRELHPGTGMCHAYHPESYLRKNLAKGFDVVDFIPQGQPDAARQDVFLLRKR